MHQTSEGVCLLAVGWQSTGGAHGLRCLSWAGGGRGCGNTEQCQESHPWREGKGFSQRRETKLQCTHGLNEHLRPKILLYNACVCSESTGILWFSSVLVSPLLQAVQ